MISALSDGWNFNIGFIESLHFYHSSSYGAIGKHKGLNKSGK